MKLRRKWGWNLPIFCLLSSLFSNPVISVNQASEHLEVGFAAASRLIYYEKVLYQ